MEFRHLCCAAIGTILLSITACDQQPKTAATHPAAAVVAKQPHPDCSRESRKYSPTAATHVSEAKVLASDNATITLFLDTNHFPFDVKGWQICRLPVADMLVKGDIHEWAGDR